jgi:hypothetical protein
VNLSARHCWSRRGPGLPSRLLLAAVLVAAWMGGALSSVSACLVGACGDDCPTHGAAASSALSCAQATPDFPGGAEFTQAECTCGTHVVPSSVAGAFAGTRPSVSRGPASLALLPSMAWGGLSWATFVDRNSSERSPDVYVAGLPGPRAPPTA